MQGANHSHHGDVGHKLFTIKRGVIKECKECQWCIPKEFSLEYRAKYHTYCEWCDEYPLLVNGSHAFCEWCQKCTGSEATHEYFHHAGECVKCTAKGEKYYIHRYCEGCGKCVPFTDHHYH